MNRIFFTLLCASSLVGCRGGEPSQKSSQDAIGQTTMKFNNSPPPPPPPPPPPSNTKSEQDYSNADLEAMIRHVKGEQQKND